MDLRELEERLGEACELVQGHEWSEWLMKLERGGKETLAAAAAARQLEQTLPLLLRYVGLLGREPAETTADAQRAEERHTGSSQDARGELEARGLAAGSVARRDSMGEMEKHLREAEKQLEELEEERVRFEAQVAVYLCSRVESLCMVGHMT